MKTSAFLLLSAFLLFSCDEEVNVSNELQGTYKMTQACGDLSGCSKPKEDFRLEISSSTYTRHSNEDETFSEEYQIIKDSTTSEGRFYLIDIENYGSQTLIISSNILTIDFGPGTSVSYRRISD